MAFALYIPFYYGGCVIQIGITTSPKKSKRPNILKNFKSTLFYYLINILINFSLVATAIRSWKYPLSSDRGSQAWNGPVSTAVGDHAGILDAVVFAFWNIKHDCFIYSYSDFIEITWIHNFWNIGKDGYINETYQFCWQIKTKKTAKSCTFQFSRQNRLIFNFGQFLLGTP